MKKSFKAIISVIVALTLVFGTASVAFADEACNCDNAPVIFVNGIGGMIYSTDENGEEYSVFPIENETMISTILTYLPAALINGIFGGWDSFAVSLDKMVTELFIGMDCDNEGNSVLPAYADDCDPATMDEHLDDNEFNFLYDWRLDPYESAAKLDAYIDEIIEATGHEKVIINAYSEGGEIALAYFDAYGSEKVEMFISQCSAFQGLTLIGKLFTNDCSVDANQLANFLGTMMPAANVDDGVTTLLKVLKYTGIYHLLTAVVNKVLDECFDTIYSGFAKDVFACMPGVFNFVPAEYFDDAIDMVFGDDPEYAVLVEKLTRYHNAQVNAEKILKAEQEKGMAIAVVSHYGCYPLPLVGDMSYQSDALIDSANSSGGATFAPMGNPFGSDYKQEVSDGHNHIAPDGSVDASTCMFPESTWFVSGFSHWCYSTNLIEWLEAYDGQPTVTSNPEFPQFLVGNPADNTVSAIK